MKENIGDKFADNNYYPTKWHMDLMELVEDPQERFFLTKPILTIYI